MTERWHFLDVMRAALMLIGVPYHAAMFFREDSRVLDCLMTFSSQWRMPAFFVIAGFFALVVVQRRGVSTWWAGRVRRLGIPLLFAVLILNPIQTLIISDWSWPSAVALWTSTADVWLFHAWFLLYLLIYCGALAILCVSAKGGGDHVVRVGSWATRGPIKFLMAVAVLSVGAVGGVAVWQVLDIPRLTFGALSEGVPSQFVAFLLGVALAAASGALSRLSTWARWPVGVAAIAGSLSLLADVPESLPGVLGGSTRVLLGAVAGLSWAAILLRVFRAHFDRASSLVRWLVAASLPVYLLHHVVVLAVGPAVADWGFHPLIGFAALTLIALVASLLGYELICRSRAGRLCMTGHNERGALFRDVLAARRPGSIAA